MIAPEGFNVSDIHVSPCVAFKAVNVVIVIVPVGIVFCQSHANAVHRLRHYVASSYAFYVPGYRAQPKGASLRSLFP